MTSNDFFKMMDEFAKKESFDFEWVLIVGDKEGKLHSFVHAWNDDVKPCSTIREVLTRIVGFGRKRFGHLTVK